MNQARLARCIRETHHLHAVLTPVSITLVLCKATWDAEHRPAQKIRHTFETSGDQLPTLRSDFSDKLQAKVLKIRSAKLRTEASVITKKSCVCLYAALRLTVRDSTVDGD